MGRRISYLLSAAAALVVVGGVAYVPAAPAAAASGRGTTAQVAYQRMQCSSTTGPDVCTSTVHVANADGTSNSVVATYSETESSTPGGTPSGQRIDGPLVWSPDGTELVTDASGNTVVVTTAGQTVFSGHTGFVTWSWSPDSREVAGEDLKAGGGSYLGILDVKTGVMNVVAANGADPAWSPDSDAIAYVDTATGDLVSTADLALKVLVTKTVLSSAIAAVDRNCPQPNATISSPAWSPDGRQVAFTATYCASPGGATAPVRIGVIDIAGGRLSLSPCCMHIPQWSPDGSVISAQPYVTWQPSTGQVTNMAFHQPAGSDFIPPTGYPWTPDATGLVYPSYPAAPGDSNDYSLRLIGADGTGDHAIPGVFTNGVFALSPSSIARRYGGVLRTDTAVAVAQATWSSANAVVIARDDLYPDGLVGGPLAAKVGGPSC
ncbi:MAG TPA: cell wall-binding repeat-containing protein [Acidimicrobiales bacterium]|nr:cell wall-binding repeat-containing protein [Acidimicrobiales bacterium]